MPALFQPHSAAVRESVRRLWIETTETVAEISAKTGVSKTAVKEWASKYSWPQRPSARQPLSAQQPFSPQPPIGARPKAATKPKPKAKSKATGLASPKSRHAPSAPPVTLALDAVPTHAELQRQILRLMARKLGAMEKEMNDDIVDKLSERDIRALTGMSQSLDKLKDLEPGHGSSPAAPQSRDPKSRNPKSRRAPETLEEEGELRRELVERIKRIRERRGK